jgi:hypothetical protein
VGRELADVGNCPHGGRRIVAQVDDIAGTDVEIDRDAGETEDEARSAIANDLTISEALSSNSVLVAPARAAWMARCLSTFWRTCSATWGVLRARDRVSRASPTLAAASHIRLHSPGDHGVDRGADLFRNALRRTDIGSLGVTC